MSKENENTKNEQRMIIFNRPEINKNTKFPTEWFGGYYTGNVKPFPHNKPCSYRARGMIDGKSFCQNFNFSKYRNSDAANYAAHRFLYDKSLEGNSIKNMMRYTDAKTLEVQLTNDQTMIVDAKHMDKINMFPLTAKYAKNRDKHYVNYCEKKIHKPFHKLITDCEVIEYTNGNTLDLREKNLTTKGVANKILLEKDEYDVNEEECNWLKDKYGVKTNSKNGITYPMKWSGGRPVGTIFKRENEDAWNIVIHNGDEVVHKYLSFNKENKYEQYKKAKKIQKEISDKKGLTRNRYRYLNHDVIEVQIGKNLTFITNSYLVGIINKYPLYATRSGTENSSYYVSILINNKLKSFHKLITGYIMVDHINRQTLDNRMENLRRTNHKMNNNNRNQSKKSTSAAYGVSYNEKDNAYRARIKQDGITYSKTFSISKYGKDEAMRLAINEREKFLDEFDSNNRNLDD